MRRSRKTHSVKKKQLCDICGDAGFAYNSSTCCICHISHEHIYCMKHNLHEIPKEWFCEACISRFMKDNRGKSHLCQKGKILCTSDSSKIIDSTPLIVGSANKNTSLQQEVVIKPPQDIPVKNKSNKPKFLDKPTGKVLEKPSDENISENEPLDALPPKKARTSVTEAMYIAQNAFSPLSEVNSNVLSKAEELPNHYAINPTWKGTFEIRGRSLPGGNYEYKGLQAHPPHQVSRKAYELSKQMPRMLQFKMHPRCDVWPEIFNIDCPTLDDVALYFLLENFSNSKEKYHYLVEFIEEEDLAMSTCLNDVELIIFTSKQLRMDSQRVNMKSFLWGVFRSSKKKLLSPSVTKETDQVVDMEIDMVGGKDIGRVDYIVKRPILEVNKVNQKIKYPISSAIDFKKLDSSKSGDRVTVSGNDEARPSNIHSDQPMKGNISPISNIKREMSTTFRAAPGFCRTVTSDVAHKGVMEKPLGRVSTVGQNLECPPGFSKFLKPKEIGDHPSKASHKKEKAVIRESPDLLFISQQVVNHGIPKNSMVRDPTRKCQSEQKQFKTDTKKCQLEQCVKETDSYRMVSLFMKDEHHRKIKSIP